MNPMHKITTLNPTKHAVTLLDEFKTFAFKGNVIDLAVGVIIGAAFGKIVDSLVKHLLMPLISVIMPGDGGYTGWKLVIRGTEIPYGLFLSEVVHFLIVAAALFLFVVKFLGWVMKLRQREEAVPPPLTRDQQLLIEIRDLLAKRATP
ncbi:MAG: large conductance mechanosensitive channel protein MscL [Gemmataceae bacterium]